MRFGAIGAAVLLLAGCGRTAPPDLSGSWQPEAAGQEAMTVEHRDPELRVRRGASSFEYATDGSETCNVVDGWMVCSRARWDGPFLQIDSTIKGEKGDRQESERWSLARDGGTLTVQRGLPQARTALVYRRR